jgi:hypothetical protein
MVALGLGFRVVTTQASRRDQAVMVRQSSLALDSLLRARIDVYAEYVPSAAIVAARAYNLTEDELDTLLGERTRSSEGSSSSGPRVIL